MPGIDPSRRFGSRCREGRFSIAARAKPRSDYLMLSPFALRQRCHTELWLLFEVGAKPPHDGLRRMGRFNLSGAIAASQRQDRRTLRTHPTRRRREDIFLPEQNASSPCPQFSWLRQPQEPRRRPCSSGTHYHRPTSGAEPRPSVWRPRRWLDGSRAAEPPAYPMPSATTISRRE
jgi:hypothetical protein